MDRKRAVRLSACGGAKVRRRGVPSSAARGTAFRAGPAVAAGIVQIKERHPFCTAIILQIRC
jgi:hypothetical protein